MNDTTWYVHRQENYLDMGSYTYKTCVLIEKAIKNPPKWDN